MKTEVKIFIADDHPIFRQGLKGILSAEQDLEVVGETADGKLTVKLNAQGIDDRMSRFDPGRVPGHHGWRLAPRVMGWEGKTLGEICAQIKDQSRNGGRSLDALARHIGGDTLVGWAWSPGFGRQPAPGTQKEAGALVEAWINTGAVCPN